MKNTYTNKIALIAAFIMSINVSVFAQSQVPVAETPNGPVVLNLGPVNPNTPDALWDVRGQFNPTTLSGSVSLAGVAWTGSEWWITRWNNDSIWIFDAGFALVAGITIPGTATPTNGIRSLTSDGTFLYSAANLATGLKKIDPTTQSVVGTIPTPAIAGAVRWATYDPTADAGAGGFWIGNFGTDIWQMSMTGAVLNTIPAAIHGLTGMYGAAWDGTSLPGVPYLWIHNQGDPQGGLSLCIMVQLDISNQALTGIQHDVDADLGNTGGIAGGAYIGTVPPFTDASLIGLDQGVEVIWYEFLPLSVNEIAKEINLNVYPNPSNGEFSVKLNLKNNEDISIQVTDVYGRVIMNDQLSKVSSVNKKYSLDNASKGNYVVKVSTSKGTATQVLVIK